MDIHEPVTVYAVTNPVEAEIIRNVLQAEGIHCYLDGVNQAVAPGAGAFEIKVQVAAGDADCAGRLIRSHGKNR
jgi:hypothetical protein